MHAQRQRNTFSRWQTQSIKGQVAGNPHLPIRNLVSEDSGRWEDSTSKVLAVAVVGVQETKCVIFNNLFKICSVKCCDHSLNIHSLQYAIFISTFTQILQHSWSDHPLLPLMLISVYVYAPSVNTKYNIREYYWCKNCCDLYRDYKVMWIKS